MTDTLSEMEVEIRTRTNIEYAEGKYLKVVPTSAIMPRPDVHPNTVLLKAATDLTDHEIDEADWARDLLDIMELISEHLDERADVEWNDDEERWIIKLSYPIMLGRAIPLTHLKMRRAKGKDMLLPDEEDDIRLVVKRIAALTDTPRNIIRKLAWADVRTCVDLFRRK